MSYEEQKNCDCGTDCDCHETAVEESEDTQTSQEFEEPSYGGCGSGCGCH